MAKIPDVLLLSHGFLGIMGGLDFHDNLMGSSYITALLWSSHQQLAGLAQNYHYMM